MRSLRVLLNDPTRSKSRIFILLGKIFRKKEAGSEDPFVGHQTQGLRVEVGQEEAE
jgi:hypothetical protein